VSSPYGLMALIRRLLGGPAQQVPPAIVAPRPPLPAPGPVPVHAISDPLPAAPKAPEPAITIPKVPTDPPWDGRVPFAATEFSEVFEARKLRPYKDSAGVWTIGIGSTRGPDGKPVTERTPAITDAQAEAMHKRDLEKAAALVKAAITYPISTRQAVVLMLLANNAGDLRVAAPTIVRLVNAGRWRDAADFLKEFRNVTVAGKRVPVLGLRRRRWAEAAYSLGMPAQEAHRRAWAEIATVDGWPKLPG